MVFKKHNWMKYGGQGAEIMEITVKDGTGRKIDFFKTNDKENSKDIAKLLNQSYGFFPGLFAKSNKELKKEVDEEVDFLKEHMDW